VWKERRGWLYQEDKIVSFSQVIHGIHICSQPSNLSVFTSNLPQLLPSVVTIFSSSYARFSVPIHPPKSEPTLSPLINHNLPSWSPYFEMYPQKKPPNSPVQPYLLIVNQLLPATILTSVNFLSQPTLMLDSPQTYPCKRSHCKTWPTIKSSSFSIISPVPNQSIQTQAT
jgi:hypothetical protein